MLNMPYLFLLFKPFLRIIFGQKKPAFLVRWTGLVGLTWYVFISLKRSGRAIVRSTN
jgi:hypothetical protein